MNDKPELYPGGYPEHGSPSMPTDPHGGQDFSPRAESSAQRRPGTRARGYDSDHFLRRQQAASEVATGLVRCARGRDCLFATNGVAALIDPGHKWDLGHDDNDRSKHTGPEHAECNRAAAGRKSQRLARAKPPAGVSVSSREW